MPETRVQSVIIFCIITFTHLRLSLDPAFVSAKRLSRCEFATKLKPLLGSEDWARLGDWICAAEELSGIDSSLQTTASEDPTSRSYGVFQINNLWWCEDDMSSKNGDLKTPCNNNCSDFLDEDITDDVACALEIKKSTDTPFKAWNGWVRGCKEKNLDQYKYLDNCTVTPQPTVPTITLLEARGESFNITFTAGTNDQYIYCRGNGTPPPELTWEYDRNALHELRNQTMTQEPLPTVRLIFPTVRAYHAGLYICNARNFYRQSNQTFHLTVKPGGGMSALSYALAIGLPLAILAAIGTSIAYYFRQILLKLNGLTEAEIREFREGIPDRLKAHKGAGNGDTDDDQAPLHENIQYMPYNKDYDIPMGKLKCDNTKILGEGQYGFVTRAELTGYGAPVAVKAVKPNTDKMYIKALLSELKIMIYLGKCPNIVGLIGAVTNGLNNGILLIVVEFCELGDLMNYLRSRKQCVTAGPAHDYQNTAAQDYQNADSITTGQLVNWCRQIAVGMEYLESKKVIHGDLAARNVLLTSTLTAKITDFGLSRQLYDYTNYVKKQQAPLPWRHMAIESLREMSFSTESDIWAFGVTIWEVFSLGDIPYPGRSWSLDFVSELENGLRLLQPKIAPDFIYEIMKACWSWSKYERPQFKMLVAQLSGGDDDQAPPNK